jgi:uncharacterized RDD family membrane protein YckC
MRAMLDTVTLVETPEGVALHLHPAGMMPRAAAWAIDFVIRVAVITTLATMLALLGKIGSGLYLVALFVVYWLYSPLFEMFRDGQTIGKRVIGLRVVHANGTPVSWLGSIVRNLLRTVDMLPVLYGCGVMASLLDRQGRRLGDMVADTLVIHVETEMAPPAAPPVPMVTPDLALSAEEKAAIVAFAERAPQLTPERQQELADLLPRLTRSQGGHAVQRLLGLASGFLGRR